MAYFSNFDGKICPQFLDGYSKEVLPWDRFNRWMTCFCVVTFDLELGQAMEVWSLRKGRFFFLPNFFKSLNIFTQLQNTEQKSTRLFAVYVSVDKHKSVIRQNHYIYEKI